MKIGEVAARSGYAISTLRYYESLGLIPEPSRQSGQRDYDERIFETLALIRAAQRAGFSLNEIHQLTQGIQSEDAPPSQKWRRLAELRFEQINAQIQQLEQQRQHLQAGMDCRCESLSECALL